MSIRFSSLTPRMYPHAWAWAAALGGVAALSGCVVAPIDDGYGDPGYSYSSTTVYTNYGYPPPPRVEYRTMAPSPSHIWVGGDWFWAGSRYDWRPGRWAAAGYRPAPPPPPRPMVQPQRPPVWNAPRPDRPMVRPDERPRPPQFRPEHNRPQPPQFNPGQRPPGPQARPEGNARPPMRPDRPMGQPPQARPDRPDRPQSDNARPPRGDGGDRRPPPQRRDRDEERRQP